MEHKKIVMLAVDCLPTNVVYHALEKDFGVLKVILEDKESMKVFLKRRIKKLGIFKVVGQILFQLSVVKILNWTSKKRQQQIIEENKLIIENIPDHKLIKVDSVNSPSTIKILEELDPDLIIVSGTRIISKKVLRSVSSKFINSHAGITPKYRGVHGAYWALINKDSKNCGVTVHFVDAGIDTGDIIYQEIIHPGKEDNFVTYPLLQLVQSVLLLKKATRDIFNKKVKAVTVSGETSLWYHPTIWQYCYDRITKKIK